MPVISMMLGEGQIDQEQKKQFIKTVTKQAAEITKIAEQSFIVSIEELDCDNVGVGGVTLSEKFAQRSHGS